MWRSLVGSEDRRKREQTALREGKADVCTVRPWWWKTRRQRQRNLWGRSLVYMDSDTGLRSVEAQLGRRRTHAQCDDAEKGVAVPEAGTGSSSSKGENELDFVAFPFWCAGPCA